MHAARFVRKDRNASTPPTLPRGSGYVARTWVVSWLRAVSLAFPDLSVQWRC